MTDQSPRGWSTLAREELLDRRPWLAVWDETVQLPDGRIVTNFSTLEMPDFVVIVAVTPERLAVVERSYKHGTRTISLHIPAGHVEPGEAPLVAAQRELLEETGYSTSDWRPLGSFVMHGNRGGGTAHLFVALDAHRVAAPDTDDLEEIAIELHPLDTLLEAAIGGEFSVISSAAAIAMAVAAIQTGAGPFRGESIATEELPRPLDA